AARVLFGRLGYALAEGTLSTQDAARLSTALLTIYQGAPVERAFMKSPHARVKAGVKDGSLRAGDAVIRRNALQLLREMNPKTDADVAAGIRKLQRKAGVKSHKTIESDIKKQLAAEAARPQWPDALARCGDDDTEVVETSDKPKIAALDDGGEWVEIK